MGKSTVVVLSSSVIACLSKFINLANTAYASVIDDQYYFNREIVVVVVDNSRDKGLTVPLFNGIR